MSTLRQQIVDALLTRFRTIKTDNGYETNAGHYVFEWKDLDNSPWNAEEVAEGAINVKDKSEPGTDSTVQGRHEKELQFELDIGTNKSVGNTLTVAQQVRKILGDIEKSLDDSGTWITGIAIRSISPFTVNEASIVQTGNVLGAARVQFSIKYTNQRFDPYNQ